MKTYGTDSLVGLLSPLLGMLFASQGMRARLQSEARILAKMEADAEVMARQGYRVVSSVTYEIRAFGVAWEKVTYELVDPPD